MTAPTPTEQATIARFEAAESAPEAYDPEVWDALSDLLPCNPMVECRDECECTAGEVRLACERLIMAERRHIADCEGDGCCDRVSRRVTHVGVWHAR